MNIHIKNKELFERLLDSTIYSVNIGSKMYGTNNENSDTDIIHIYKTSEAELNSILNSHHQIQYKDNNIDYIFVSLHSFLRNLLSGDSTINFEVINHIDILTSELSFLYEMRKSFYNYKIMRSYLGFGRRDLKQLNKGEGDRGKNKKLFHAYRCWKSCLDIYNEDFNAIMDDSDSFEMFTKINKITDYKERDLIKKELLEKIDSLRNKLNSDYDSNKLINYMKVDDQRLLDMKIKNIMNNEINSMYLSFDEMNLFYDAEENGIKY